MPWPRFVLALLSSFLIADSLPLAAQHGPGDLAYVTTIAGVPRVPGFLDGPANSALLNRPTWLDVVPGPRAPYPTAVGDIFVVDRANQAIRSLSGTTVRTLQIVPGYWDPTTPVTFDFGGPGGGGIAFESAGGGCGGSEYDDAMWVANSGRHQIALISAVGKFGARDDILPFIGVAGQAGYRNGSNTEALFNAPAGIALSWNYSQSYLVREMYIADSGNHVIRRVRFTLSFEACPQGKLVDTLAGTPGVGGAVDGPLTQARFNGPRGVAAGPDGSVYVADTENHTIRRISPDGQVSTIAGEPGVAGSDDGPATSAHLRRPMGIDVNAAGEIFIADAGNHAIRKLTGDGMLVTVAGVPGIEGFADGEARKALFAGPVDVKIAPDGALLVADTSNHVIRRIGALPERHRPARR